MFAALQNIYRSYRTSKRRKKPVPHLTPLTPVFPAQKINPAQRLYVAPKTNYDVPLAILRARLESRYQIMKQDRHLQDHVSLSRNMIAASELEEIIKIREDEYEQYRQNNRCDNP